MGLLDTLVSAVPIAGQVYNVVNQSNVNKKQIKFATETRDLQRQWAIDDWNKQNAYNDPLAQMQRLQNAGLNPHLVYGSGADAQSQSPVRSSPSPQPSIQANKVDLGSVMFNAMQMKQLQSNIARTDAETRAIDARTTGVEFQNQLNSLIGLDKMADRYGWATDSIAIKSQKDNAEYEAWKAGSFTGTFDDKNSPIAKAIRAGYSQTETALENAKKLGDLRSFETEIKQFQAGLAKQGISPDSPWYVKLVVDLVSKVLDRPITDLIKP